MFVYIVSLLSQFNGLFSVKVAFLRLIISDTLELFPKNSATSL